MKIVFTIGDCNGIGIEVMLKGILDFDANCELSSELDFYFIGHYQTLTDYLENYNFPVSVSEDKMIINNRICPILNCTKQSKVEFGKETKSAGELAAEAIELAVSKTLLGEFDSIVTMPVSKTVLYSAGWKYPGHTEMLANACNVDEPLMILCSDDIRVGLVTVHVPIKNVSQLVTAKLIIDITKKFNQSLTKDYGIANPNIAVLGLNPHAGEAGGLGNEEIEVIIPALEELKGSGINVFGPFPSDGFFAHGEYKKFDGILAMYHDQGLIPLKLLAKGAGVNYTAGLPIVRTSPDHGTAFSIAGKNKADGFSVRNAIELCIKIIKNRSNN